MKILFARFASLVALLAMLAFAACGGGSSSTVTQPPPQYQITSVALTCPESSLPVRLQQQCTASVQGTGDFPSTVTWATTGGSISQTGVLIAPTTATTITVTATSIADSTKSGTANITITAVQKATAFTYKAVNHVSWWPGEYSSPAGALSEAAIASTGSDWAGLLATQYMATKTSTSIAPNNSTPTDADLLAAISQLHNNGIKVMLKPHVDVLDGSWRGQIVPSDVGAWFANYTTFITHYAQLAEANNVEMLCIGTEFATMTGRANHAAWNNVIAAIRAVYSGKLTYAANATTSTDEFTSVTFWDSLDIIGLDGYFPLTNHADPKISELVAAWSHNKNGENIVQGLQNFIAAHPGKEVMFTEIGYRSVVGANMAPWDWSTTGTVDNIEQQNCYEALYRVWGQGTTLKGHFLWAWPVNPPGATDTDYNPRNKPAQTVMQNWLISD